MPAYMYPINIKREPKIIRFQETKQIESDILSLKDLQFVGEDKFDIELSPYNTYIITVYRSRLETSKEMNDRILKEENYMKEYNKRNT